MKTRFIIVAIVALFMLTSSGTVSAANVESGAVPTNWIQMDEDGIFYNTDNIPHLFVFGSDLYAYDDHGLYRMQLVPCLMWTQPTVPVSPGNWGFQPVDNVLYMSSDGFNQLWWIRQGEAFTIANWKKVVSSGLPSGSSMVPKTLFNGQLYAAVYPTTSDTFDIYRSPDIGKASMTWTKVVSNGFGDPQNHNLGFLAVFNNKLIAVTTMTRTSMFGDPSRFGSGIEVWESPTGDTGSWTQVNQDGFGTEVTQPITGLTFRTNQDVGSWAVYKGHLYIGTKSHWGAEVWRYNGTGLNGWTDVTPPWGGVAFGSGPGRNEDMVVFQDLLYLAEGFPTGNLAYYNGTAWTIAVPGPNPFEPSNSGIYLLAVLDDKIYAAMRGGQVWGYPYSYKPLTCSVLSNATINLTPDISTNELGTPGQTHTVTAKVEAGVDGGVSGVSVNFEVISGPNVGTSGSGITGGNGEATFTYTAVQGMAGMGTDVIEACFTHPQGDEVCDQATKDWVVEPVPTLTPIGLVALFGLISVIAISKIGKREN